MLGPKFQNITLTLLTCLILALTVSADANAFGRHRLIRKRSPFPAASAAAARETQSSTADSNLAAGLIPAALSGAAADPPSGDDLSSSSSLSLSSSSTTSADGLLSTLSGVSAVSSSSSSASLSASLSASSVSASASASASASLSASSSASSSSSSSKTSSTSKSEPTPSAETPVQQTSTVTSIATASATAADTEVATSNSGLSTKSKTALITVLIVVAASVGGVAILWTIFRKWKLGHSAKFDERLQPIDWQPTHGDDADFRPRRHSGMSYSSGFGGYGATSDHGHNNLQSIPDHDFTAGASHLAPVGGYADLSRGPSPQPYMQENLARGPSLNKSNYDAGVPLHHQGGF